MPHPDRLPPALRRNLAVPVVAAPMFLASGPDLVVEACASGVIGTFPALNQRTTAGFADWVRQIQRRLAATPAPAAFGVNLIVHRSNPRLAADLEVCIAARVPLVITSLGAVPDLVARVQAYGGLVFHDVISARHAEKAAAAGVDGIVAVAAGAGGHAGTLNPFALLTEVRRHFAGPIALAGAINSGAEVLAARALGADLAWVGTRFLATREAMIADGHKQMIARARAGDIVYTDRVSGVPGNFLRDSLGTVLDDTGARTLDIGAEVKAWRDAWSAGQGVGGITDIPSTAALCHRIATEYTEARARLMSDPLAPPRRP
ncbi:NAD(P)H-dependent flavin oxidoreductase [Rhodobaculum claviforme]|uniref:Nitronate monooxygenase n=1 Tax=Rhodobaculum claviforme TaxID=1549854 RepID=A0A934WKD0_9RHOB|nr:nitronate monooxygenase [Rhodobaculum claviforme]MBK5928862.1 nitronate monooxygenase [Rhodobaculum claviforme]